MLTRAWSSSVMHGNWIACGNGIPMGFSRAWENMNEKHISMGMGMDTIPVRVEISKI